MSTSSEQLSLPAISANRDVSRALRIGIPLGVILATVLVFWTVGQNEFLNWDDVTMLQENPRILSAELIDVRQFWLETATGFQGLYAPMSYTVWWAVARIFGIRTDVFHLLNLGLHCCCVALVYGIVLRVLSTKAPAKEAMAGSALGALIFALHPMQVEVVAWVSACNNLVAGCFGLYAVMRFLDSLKETSRARALEWYAFGSIALVLALFSKPTALVFPPIAVVVALLAGHKLRRIIPRAMLWAAVLIPFIMIGRHVQPMKDMVGDLSRRPMVIADAYGFYIAHMMVPYPISPDYGRLPGMVLAQGLLSAYWLVFVGSGLVALALWKRSHWPALCLGLLVVGILPNSGTVPFYFQNATTVTDRYVYSAMLAAALLVGWVVASRPRRTVIYAVLAVALVFGTYSRHLVGIWRTTLVMGHYCLEHNPDSMVGLKVLGATLGAEGDGEIARGYLEHAMRVNEQDSGVIRALARLHLVQKRPVDGMSMAILLLDRKPDDAEYYGLVCSAAQKMHAPELAIKALNHVQDLGIDNAEVHAHIGWMYGTLGDYAKARHHFVEALRRDPRSAMAMEGLGKLATVPPRSAHATTRPATHPAK